MKSRSGICEGDRVLLLKGSVFEEGAQTGETGTVIDVKPRRGEDFDLVFVRWDSGKDWSFYSYDLRLVDSADEGPFAVAGIESLFEMA